jgi:hypothetical protein
MADVVNASAFTEMEGFELLRRHPCQKALPAAQLVHALACSLAFRGGAVSLVVLVIRIKFKIFATVGAALFGCHNTTYPLLSYTMSYEMWHKYGLLP